MYWLLLAAFERFEHAQNNGGYSKPRYTTIMAGQRFLIRNTDARDLLDIFVVSAASSIVFVRFYLHITGYPTVGGSKYHIAHMLWGGFFMLIAFVLNFAFLGARLHKFVAFLAGVGFGVFIDEIGKFITHDNNYFFRPAVGIIYAILVVLYLTTRILTRKRPLTHTEYQMNALRRLEEAVHQDMDLYERAATRKLLRLAHQKDPLTKRLHALLDEIPVAPAARPGPVQRFRTKLLAGYEALLRRKRSSTVLRWFFALEALGFVAAVLVAVYASVDDVRGFFLGQYDYGYSLIMGQLLSTIAAALCVLAGLRWVAASRLRAFEWFRRATLINLLLTQFFEFSRIEFGAMPGFVCNLVLLMAISTVIDLETQHDEAINETA